MEESREQLAADTLRRSRARARRDQQAAGFGNPQAARSSQGPEQNSARPRKAEGEDRSNPWLRGAGSPESRQAQPPAEAPASSAEPQSLDEDFGQLEDESAAALALAAQVEAMLGAAEAYRAEVVARMQAQLQAKLKPLRDRMRRVERAADDFRLRNFALLLMVAVVKDVFDMFDLIGLISGAVNAVVTFVLWVFMQSQSGRLKAWLAKEYGLKALTVAAIEFLPIVSILPTYLAFALSLKGKVEGKRRGYTDRLQKLQKQMRQLTQERLKSFQKGVAKIDRKINRDVGRALGGAR